MLQALGHIYIYPHVKGLLNSALQHIHVLTRAFVSLKKKKKTRALDNSLSSQCLDPILTPIVKFIQKYDVTSSYELWNLLPCFSIILVSGSSLVTYISVRVCWAELIFYIHFFLMSHFFHYINVFLLNLLKKKKKKAHSELLE